MSKAPCPDPVMFWTEDRGYGRGTGSLLMPDGKVVSVSHEDLSVPLNNVLAQEVWAAWEEYMSYIDPPEPGDLPQSLKPKDLKNKLIVLKPESLGEWPAKAATAEEKASGPRPYVECQCWVIDGSDEPEAYEPNIRISWTRVVDGLAANIGQYIVGVVKEQDDNSIIVAPANDKGKQAVDKVWAVIGGGGQVSDKDDGFADDEEPF